MLHSTTAMIRYTVPYAYRLGDYYKQLSLQNQETQMKYILCAKLCYSLTMIQDHPYNIRDQIYINGNKLNELNEFQVKHGINITSEFKQELCPREILLLLKSFYQPWNNDIKRNLKKRSKEHIATRMDAFKTVFIEMNVADKRGIRLVEEKLKEIQFEMLQKQHEFIDTEWKGPDFRHLQLQKLKGEIVDRLTAVYDKKGYSKRCNNSQEDWLRKYNGSFLASSIKAATQVFGNNNRLKIDFGLKLLTKKVKFASSRETDLIPGGWIFGASCGDLGDALTKLLSINIKNIKQKGGKKTKQREILINLIEEKKDDEYQSSKTISSLINADDDNKINQQQQIAHLQNVNNQLRQQMAQLRRQLQQQQQQQQPLQQQPLQQQQSPSVYSTDDTATVPSIASTSYINHCNNHQQHQPLLNNDHMSNIPQHNDIPMSNGMLHAQPAQPRINYMNFTSHQNGGFYQNGGYNQNGGYPYNNNSNSNNNMNNNNMNNNNNYYVVVNRSPPPMRTVYGGHHHQSRLVSSQRYNPMSRAYDNNHNDDNNTFLDESQAEVSYLIHNQDQYNSVIDDVLSIPETTTTSINFNSRFQ